MTEKLSSNESYVVSITFFFIETILNESDDDMKVSCNVSIEVRGNKL